MMENPYRFGSGVQRDLVRCPSRFRRQAGALVRCTKDYGHPMTSERHEADGCTWSDEHSEPGTYEDGFRDALRELSKQGG